MVWLSLFIIIGQAAAATHEKTLLRDIQVLTFKPNQFTTGRRSSPLPQMTCHGANCRVSTNLPEAIQCKNVGFDGKDVNWRCEAQLTKGLRLVNTQVGCEGFDHPDDPYILVGSCAIDYEIAGQVQKQQQEHKPRPIIHKVDQIRARDYDVAFALVFLMSILVIATIILCSPCSTTTSQTNVYAAPPSSPPVSPQYASAPPEFAAEAPAPRRSRRIHVAQSVPSYAPAPSYVAATAPPVVVVQDTSASSYNSGWFDGYVTSSLSRPLPAAAPAPQHHYHREEVHHYHGGGGGGDEPANSSPPPPAQAEAGEKETSVSYSTTKRR